MLFSVLLLF